MLYRDGWVHHLRRHVIADYLTRGTLQTDWMLGESLFRQMLLDHDAAINRCNWLWLSASDFSAKQLIYHYNANDYVRRQSTALTKEKSKTSKPKATPKTKQASNRRADAIPKSKTKSKPKPKPKPKSKSKSKTKSKSKSKSKSASTSTSKSVGS